MTRNVRAYNVRVGDELPWFDTKQGREVTMICTGTDQSFPGVQQLYLRRYRGRTTYRWNMKSNALVRVRRAL